MLVRNNSSNAAIAPTSAPQVASPAGSRELAMPTQRLEFSGQVRQAETPAPARPGSCKRSQNAMTASSLKAWAEAAHVDPRERSQRLLARQLILKALHEAAGGKPRVLLELSGLDRLTSLPDNLHVPGSLYLYRCIGLRELPPGLQVEGLLDLEECTSLRVIPASTVVWGRVLASKCPNITSLPESLLYWPHMSPGRRIVELRHSGISQELAGKLQALAERTKDDRYSQFHFNTPPYRAPWVKPLKTLQEVKQFWSGNQDVQPTLAATEHPDLPTLIAFSAEMQKTAFYAHPAARPTLMRRMEQLIAAWESGPASAAVIEAVGEAVQMAQDPDEDCDLVKIVLPSLEEIVAAYTALASDAPRENLRKVAQTRLKQIYVNEYAEKRSADWQCCDSIEARLAFTAGLKSRLGLTEVALFDPTSLSQVTDEELSLAEVFVHTEYEPFEAEYLADWPYLVDFDENQRREAIQRQVYADLPRLPDEIVPAADACCPITLILASQLEQPVAVPHRDGVTFYEYKELAKWWVKTGTDPMHSPLKLDDLRRPYSATRMR